MDEEQGTLVICKLYGWKINEAGTGPFYHPRVKQWLSADRYEDHPRLGGSGTLLRTSELEWIDLEYGYAQTKTGTLYKLVGPQKED